MCACALGTADFNFILSFRKLSLKINMMGIALPHDLELGAYDDRASQPFPVARPIAFDGYRVVARARE